MVKITLKVPKIRYFFKKVRKQAGIALGSQPRLDKVLVKFEVEFGVGELDPLLLESHYAKF